MLKKIHKKIVILTGAGISAESGISTFRDSGGLWERHQVEDVATPEAFERNPQLVWKFYSMRRLQAALAQPNKAHQALVEFALSTNASVSLITQNVDNLHHRADISDRLPAICMHGSLHQSRCSNCGNIYLDDFGYFNLEGNYAPQSTILCTASEKASENYLHNYKLEFKNFLPLSPCCKTLIRPHIVWFGEIPMHMTQIDHLLSEADLFISIGTSGQVYPAAGFLQIAKANGAKTVCINKEEIPHGRWIDEYIIGEASMTVPNYFSNLARDIKTS
jgi:NAD-dependent deacetylase